MTQFWHTLQDNIVCLLIMLPIVGAMLVIVMGHVGIDTSRRTALTNVSVSLFLAMLMIFHYDSGRTNSNSVPTSSKSVQTIQMTTLFGWVGERRQATPDSSAPGTSTVTVGPNIQFVVGVDGISLWFVALSVIVTFAVILGSWTDQVERPAGFYAVLLLLESACVGAFAALDVILFCFFMEAALVLVAILVAHWGGQQRRSAVQRLVIANLAASSLLLVGLMSLVLSYSAMRATAANPHPPLTFFIPHLSIGIPELVASTEFAREYWSRVSPWIFLAICGGLSIKVALWPFHTWLTETNTQSSKEANVFLNGIILLIACHCCLRFVIPIFPEICVRLAPIGAIWILLTIAFAVLIALNRTDLYQLFSWLSITAIGISLLSFLGFNRMGIVGGVINLLASSLAIPILFLSVNRQQRTTTRSADSQQFPPISGFDRIVVAIAVATLIGIPGSIGFISKWLMLLGFLEEKPYYAIFMLAVTLIVVWLFIDLLFRKKAETSVEFRPSRDSSIVETTSVTRVVGLLPFAVFIVLIGVAPGFVIERMESTVANLVRVYESVE